MLVSFNWLKEFVRIEQSPEEIAELLTMGGIEVEGLSHVGDKLGLVYTAKIEEITPHPSSDKLSLATISLGDRKEMVVCGAPNIQVGQIVPYAAPGAVLPSGLEIVERKIRGVSSPGMICSEKELALGEDASGILVFEGDVPLGLPLAKALPIIDDYLLETSVTPNRGDCLSILGIAREVAALTNNSWKTPEFVIEEDAQKITEKVRVDVPDYDLCPRYAARLVEGVTVGPSPFEIRLKLTRSGVRPISNVVDATNLILLECGQPLHAFDYDLLEEGRLVIRRADPGEVFTTLDNVERKLPKDALMIRDGKRSVALGGIMGGLNSEINDHTTNVLIESASFERFGIRRTAKTLGMSTEASFRFERGVDPEGTIWAAHRVTYLIWKLAGGKVRAGYIDVYPEAIARPPVKVRTEKVNRLLGTDLDREKVSGYLQRLGIGVKEEDGDALTCSPPSWRWDLEREEDMIEEVARVHGFQNIPVSTPRYRSAPDRTRDQRRRIGTVQTLMNASSFTEVITMSFVSADDAKEFVVGATNGNSLSLLNPLTEDAAVMRTSLLPGLLKALKRNASHRLYNLKLYEIGKTFTPVPGEELPREDLRLSGLAAGARYAPLWHFQRGEIDERGKIDSVREVDFYDVKGPLETLLEGLGVEGVTFRPSTVPFLHPGKSADMFVNDECVGFLGELSPAKTREHDLAGKIQIFEIFLEPLLIHYRKERAFKPIPRYPYIERDLSVIVEEKVSGDLIKHLISRLGHDIICSVILFDIYRGESIPANHKSMAFRIRYQSDERTLKDEEVEGVHAQVVAALTQEVGAALRE